MAALVLVVVALSVPALSRSSAAPLTGQRYLPAPAPSVSSAYRVAVIGDTYTGGSANDSGITSRWPTLLSRKRSWNSPLLFTASQMGYVNKGLDGSVVLDHVASIVAAQPNGVLVATGASDASVPDAQFTAAVEQAAAALQKGLPGARIALLSPFAKAAPPPDVVRMTNDVRSIAAAHGVLFVDVSSVFSAPAGLVGRDKTYPTDAGQVRIFDAVQAALPPAFPGT